MILINETQFDAKLLRTILTDDVMIATIVAKAGYALTESGRLELLPRQPAVLGSPEVMDGVAFPPDAGYGKQGVDVLVVGSAHAPSGLRHRVLMVGVTLGEVSLSVAVIGDRRWQKRWPGWVPSDPQPFIDMPLTWANAFGGRARVRGTEIPHPLNPEGKGYVLDQLRRSARCGRQATRRPTSTATRGQPPTRAPTLLGRTCTYHEGAGCR